MTPEQAWDILNQVTALVALKREDHQAVIKALEILKPKQAE